MNPYNGLFIHRPLSIRIIERLGPVIGYMNEKVDIWIFNFDPFIRRIYPLPIFILSVTIGFFIFKCYYGNICSSYLDSAFITVVIFQSVCAIGMAHKIYNSEPVVNSYRRRYENMREHKNRHVNMGYVDVPFRAEHDRELRRLEGLLEINN